MADHIYIRLHPRQDVSEKLVELCRARDIRAACVVSGGGFLQSADLEGVGRLDSILTHRPLTLVSLTGMFNGYGDSLYAAIADGEGRTRGGRLRAAQVASSVELVVSVARGLNLDWVFDEQTGRDELVIEPRSES